MHNWHPVEFYRYEWNPWNSTNNALFSENSPNISYVIAGAFHRILLLFSFHWQVLNYYRPRPSVCLCELYGIAKNIFA